LAEEGYVEEPVHIGPPKFLLQVIGLTPGIIISRPSKRINPPCPATADVKCLKTGADYIAHLPLLGCNGLTEVGSEIYMTDLYEKKRFHPDCTQTVFLSMYNEGLNQQIIGVFPRIAHELVESALEKNYFYLLHNVREFKRNVPMVVEGKINSCFDFTGTCEDEVPFIMQVINVPFADYEDLSQKERKEMEPEFKDRPYDSKIAFYPDGARRKAAIDETTYRAIRDLTTIKSESMIRCILCYVIERTDVDRFQPSRFDPLYRTLVREAIDSGAIIINMVVTWSKEGRAYFVRDNMPCIKF
jgi:DNA-binding sugar fermentation-stimulating protein